MVFKIGSTFFFDFFFSTFFFKFVFSSFQSFHANFGNCLWLNKNLVILMRKHWFPQSWAPPFFFRFFNLQSINLSVVLHLSFFQPLILLCSPSSASPFHFHALPNPPKRSWVWAIHCNGFGHGLKTATSTSWWWWFLLHLPLHILTYPMPTPTYDGHVFWHHIKIRTTYLLDHSTGNLPLINHSSLGHNRAHHIYQFQATSSQSIS